jgi:hypothetical protein
VSNPASPLVNGPFGSFGIGTTITTGFAGSFAVGGLTPSGTEALANNAGVFAASFTFGDGRVAAFTDEEAFASSGFIGGSALLSPISESIFLNSFAYSVTPVPEPASVLGVAVAVLGVGGFVRRRRRVRGNPPADLA